jgi:nucleotide-binding universal stress UspA family protein
MTILIATDGSDVAITAARRGLGLLRNAGHLTVLSVGDEILDDGAGGIEGPLYTPEEEETARENELKLAKDAIAATRAAIVDIAPDVVVDERVEMGDPAATICLVAEELKADAIILGSHGKGFLARTFLGSVSEHVTRHAPCPVLVVRSRKGEDRGTKP